MTFGDIIHSPWAIFVIAFALALRLWINLQKRRKLPGEKSTWDKIKKTWMEHFLIVAAVAMLFGIAEIWFNHVSNEEDIPTSVKKFEAVIALYAHWADVAEIKAWKSVVLLMFFMILRRWAITPRGPDLTRRHRDKRTHRVEKLQTGVDFYKPVTGYLALIGVVLSSFSFMSAGPTSLVGKVQARLKDSKESYAYLRRVVRADLEAKTLKLLIERAQIALPPSLVKVRGKSTELERKLADIGLNEILFKIEVEDTPPSHPAEAAETNEKTIDDWLRANGLPTDDTVAEEQVTFIPPALLASLTSAIKVAKSDSGWGYQGPLEHELAGDSRKRPEIHEQGAKIIGAIAEAVLGEKGAEQFQTATGLPPLTVDFILDGKSDLTESLVMRIWSVADQIAKGQLKPRAPDVGAAIHDSAQTIASSAQIQWKEPSQSVIDDILRNLDSEADSADSYLRSQEVTMAARRDELTSQNEKVDKQVSRLRERLQHIQEAISSQASASELDEIATALRLSGANIDQFGRPGSLRTRLEEKKEQRRFLLTTIETLTVSHNKTVVDAVRQEFPVDFDRLQEAKRYQLAEESKHEAQRQERRREENMRDRK